MVTGNAIGAQGTTTRATYTDSRGTREFVVHRPANVTATQRALVVMLHGCTQNADDFARGTRMNDAADREGFVVLYPEQPAANHPQKCWNWYAADPSGEKSEAALLAGVIDSVARAEGVSAQRIAVAGMSAGGAMAANLAALYPDRIAAVAIHSGIPALAAADLPSALRAMQGGAPTADELATHVLSVMGARARAMPVIAIHGADDKVVSPLNLDRIAEQWKLVNGRVAAGREVPVERHLLPGVGHAWSGGSADGSYTAPGGPDATALIVSFFRRAGVFGR